MSLQAEIRKQGDKAYAVILMPSDSNPKVTYTVDVTNGRCSCPAWKFQRGGSRKVCKHLQRLGFQPKEAVEVVNGVELL